jgi:hypothetical protein
MEPCKGPWPQGRLKPMEGGDGPPLRQGLDWIFQQLVQDTLRSAKKRTLGSPRDSIGRCGALSCGPEPAAEKTQFTIASSTACARRVFLRPSTGAAVA